MRRHLPLDQGHCCQLSKRNVWTSYQQISTSWYKSCERYDTTDTTEGSYQFHWKASASAVRHTGRNILSHHNTLCGSAQSLLKCWGWVTFSGQFEMLRRKTKAGNLQGKPSDRARAELVPVLMSLRDRMGQAVLHGHSSSVVLLGPHKKKKTNHLHVIPWYTALYVSPARQIHTGAIPRPECVLLPPYDLYTHPAQPKQLVMSWWTPTYGWPLGGAWVPDGRGDSL